MRRNGVSRCAAQTRKVLTGNMLGVCWERGTAIALSPVQPRGDHAKRTSTPPALCVMDDSYGVHLLPSRASRGFTLIELLIVVVIIGILAAIAIPKFTDTKGKAYATSLKTDLRNLASSQEDYFYYHETYTTGIGGLNFAPSQGVVLTVTEATANGWSATATHPSAAPLTCAVYYGTSAPVAPAITEGQVRCQ